MLPLPGVFIGGLPEDLADQLLRGRVRALHSIPASDVRPTRRAHVAAQRKAFTHRDQFVGGQMSTLLTNWPWWIGAVAFGTLVVAYWRFVGYPMGASGSWS